MHPHGLDDVVGAGVGGRRALDELFSLAYDELRRLAASVRRGEGHAPTLSPTALVNEAWIKLTAAPPAGSLSRLHFKRIAARAMRQVLVEAARRRMSHKRGAGIAPVTFDEEIGLVATGADQLLALDAALAELAQVHPRQASMVECRFFGGLDVAETAHVLQVSEATLLRDWRAAKAWLAAQIRRTA